MERQNQRLFDRSAYSPTTISIYQLVSAYFVDIYYNHLYTEAIKFKTDGKVASVTEGYRHATFAFLSAIDDKAKKTYKVEHYNKLLKGINEYFIFWTTYNSLTLSECITKIVSEFVPDDYCKSLDKDQRRNILRAVIIDSIREFTKVVISEYLGAIIDNHDEVANVEALKDKMIDIFIAEREKMFHKFMDCRTGGNGREEKVDKRFAEKMRAEIIKLNEMNDRLVNENKELRNELDIRKEQLSQVIQKYKRVESMYRSAVAEYNISKEKIVRLEEAVRSRDSDEESFMPIPPMPAPTQQPSNHQSAQSSTQQSFKPNPSQQIQPAVSKQIPAISTTKPRPMQSGLTNPAPGPTNTRPPVASSPVGGSSGSTQPTKLSQPSNQQPVVASDSEESDETDDSDDEATKTKMNNAIRAHQTVHSTDLGAAPKISDIF